MAALIGIKVRGWWIGADISYPVSDEAGDVSRGQLLVPGPTLNIQSVITGSCLAQHP